MGIQELVSCEQAKDIYIDGMNYCFINREVIKKYSQLREYFNRHIIERIIRNKLYTGIVEYGGVEYKLLDYIVYDKLIKKCLIEVNILKVLRL